MMQLATSMSAALENLVTKRPAIVALVIQIMGCDHDRAPRTTTNCRTSQPHYHRGHQSLSALDDSLVKGIALRDSRAIPSSQQVSNVRGAGGGTGWINPVPLQTLLARIGSMQSLSLTMCASGPSSLES
jgi:hypothetical protein